MWNWSKTYLKWPMILILHKCIASPISKWTAYKIKRRINKNKGASMNKLLVKVKKWLIIILFRKKGMNKVEPKLNYIFVFGWLELPNLTSQIKIWKTGTYFLRKLSRIYFPQLFFLLLLRKWIKLLIL